MEGVREIMTQKVLAKIALQRGICEWFAIFFLFGNASEQFGYGEVIRHACLTIIGGCDYGA